MDEQATRRVVVAVLTFRRPDDLAELLPLLVEQATEVDADVMVVDNDPEGSAREDVTAFGDPRVRYVHEPHPGIAAARNRALDEAHGAEVLVFIDDDERPGEHWLARMVELYRRERCAAVVGPVISEYAHEPERWITEGQFFARRRLPTGTTVEAAATNNLLLDLREVDQLGLRFDERFGLSGGSDTLFTRRLTRAGRRIVWCDEAPVVDAVPAHRLTRRWVLQKAFRSGNSWSRTSLEMCTSGGERLRQRLVLTARGLVRFLGGAARFLAGVVTRSMARQARGLRTLLRGAGLVTGAFGYTYVEYRRAK